MTDAGHPLRHGYVQCVRCGTWRRRDRMRLDMFGVECEDTPWCIRQLRPVEASHHATDLLSLQEGLDLAMEAIAGAINMDGDSRALVGAIIADAVESATDDAFIEWCRTPEARQAFDRWAEQLAVESPETASHASIGDAVGSVGGSEARIAKAGQ